MEPFCRNSQLVEPVGCFRRGVLSLMFDGILNVTLSEKVSTTGVTQGNLELPLLSNSLNSHQTQNQSDEICDSPHTLISFKENSPTG